MSSYVVEIGPHTAVAGATSVGQTARRSVTELRRAVSDASNAHDQDFAIWEFAVACLERSPYLPLRSVRCDVHNGVLTLRGRVSSFYLKQMALATVRNVEGALKICNDVIVGKPGTHLVLHVGRILNSAAAPRPLPR